MTLELQKEFSVELPLASRVKHTNTPGKHVLSAVLTKCPFSISMEIANIVPRFPIKETQLSNDILVNYVLSAIGIFTTLVRLADRIYHHRFWHDDIAAIVCMCFQIMFMVMGSLYMEDPGNVSMSVISGFILNIARLVGQNPKLRVALHVM
jgi:hypothetical protein